MRILYTGRLNKLNLPQARMEAQEDRGFSRGKSISFDIKGKRFALRVVVRPLAITPETIVDRLRGLERAKKKKRKKSLGVCVGECISLQTRVSLSLLPVPSLFIVLPFYLGLQFVAS